MSAIIKAPRSLWRHRDFLLLWAGQSTSVLGHAVTVLAMPLVALTLLHASTFEVAVLAAVGQLPVLLFALPGGALVDRHRKRPIMIGADLVRAVFIASVPLAAMADMLSIQQLYVVAFVNATAAVMFDAAYHSYTPVVIGRDQLVDGNGKLGVTDSFAQFAGPSLAGLLGGVIGIARTLFIDAVTYAISVVSLSLIRTPEPRPAPRPASSNLRKEISAGLRFVVTHPQLRPVVLCNANDAMFLSFINAIWMIHVVRDMGWSPQAAGLVLGISATGGVIGGLVVRPLVERLGIGRVLLICEAAKLPCSIVTPFAPPGLAGQVLVTVGFMLLLVSAVAYNITQRTFRQLLCPPDLLGRMNAGVRWLQWGLMPLGATAAGVVATYIGTRITLIIGSLGLGIGLLVLYLSGVSRIITPGQPDADVNR